MRAEKENLREIKERREKKWESKLFVFSTRMIFSCAQWLFFGYTCIKKTVSTPSRSYPLLFAIKISMVSQFGDL